jgi:hypothetical protein
MNESLTNSKKGLVFMPPLVSATEEGDPDEITFLDVKQKVSTQ